MKTLTDLFEPYIGTKEYNGIVATIQKWFYGDLVKASWCATSMSYFADQLGILDQLGGKNENVYRMMKAAEAANKKTGKGTFKYKADIKHGETIRRGTVLFLLNSDAPMTENSSKHVTTVYQDFTAGGAQYCRCLGGNQSDSIKVSSYYQSRIYAIFEPAYTTEGGSKPDTTEKDTAEHPTLRKGSKGEDVKVLQRALVRFGYKDGSGQRIEVDGSFGSKTRAAVQNLQRDQGLSVDGVCGPKTWKRLDDLAAAVRAVTVKTALNCRTLPDMSCPVKTVLQTGQTYEATRTAGGWLYLPAPDGWVYGKYVK